MLLATGQMKTRATNQTKENGIRSIYAINKETQTETHKLCVCVSQNNNNHNNNNKSGIMMIASDSSHY